MNLNHKKLTPQLYLSYFDSLSRIYSIRLLRLFMFFIDPKEILLSVIIAAVRGKFSSMSVFSVASGVWLLLASPDYWSIRYSAYILVL